MSTPTRTTLTPSQSTDEMILAQGEQRFQAIFEQAAVGVAQVATDGRWMDINRRMCEILGYTRDELRTRTFQNITHPDDLDGDLDQMRRVLAGEVNTYSREKRFRRKDGSLIWANLSVSLVRDSIGEPKYFIAVVEDIDARKRAEAALREHEQLLHLFVTHTPAAVAMFDRDMRYVAASRRWVTDYHLKDAEIVGRSHYEVFPEMSEAWKQVHRRGLAGATEHHDGEPFPRADGTIDWVRWEMLPWRTTDGAIGGIILFSEVVTDRHRAEDARRKIEAELIRSHAALQLYIDTVPSFIAVVDARGRYELVNCRYEEWFALPAARIIGRELRELHRPSTYAAMEPHIREVMSGRQVRYESSMTGRDGKPYVFDVRYVPRRLPDGAQDGYFVLADDVTAFWRAQQLLRLHEERLDLAVRASNIGLWDWNLLTNEVAFSREWKSQLGYQEREIAAEFGEWERRVHPDDLGPIMERVRHSLSCPDTPYEAEFRMLHKDGSWRWIYARGTVTHDAGGRPARMLGCHIDITERHRDEQALLASEARFRQLFEENLAGVFRSTPDGRCMECNDAFVRMLGYESKADLLARHAADFYPTPGHRDRYWAELRQRRELKNYEIELRRKDGSVLWGLENVTLVRGSDGAETIQGTVIDITETKRLGMAVRQSEAILRAAIDSLNASTAVVDRSGRILSVNRAWRAFAEQNNGRGPGVLEGANYLDVCDAAGEEFPEARLIAQGIRTVLAGGPEPGPVEYACHSPQQQRWFQACIHGFQRGDERFSLVTHQCVTAVRRAAEREAVATIASGVAHEFNSLLFAAAMQLHGHPTDRTPGAGDSDTSKAVELIHQAQALASALLNLYAGPDTNKAELLSLYPWLPEAVARLATALPPGIHVVTEVEFDLPEAMGHRLGLEQVVRNLLVNAANVLGDHGEVRVLAMSATVDGRAMVEIRVSDNGPGIPEALRSRVFEPGFTTTSRSYRSGLGLAIAARLLEQFGGTISYEPNTPTGSTFVIRLPARAGDTP